MTEPQVIAQVTAQKAESGWHGRLHQEFEYSQGTTSVSHCQACAPLKVQRAFYPEGKAVCHSVILHTAGGMVGGDRLSLDLRLHPQSQTLITTSAAGKIYRSQGLTAQQTIHIQVAEGACLEWLPRETIVFNGAQYDQNLRVELAAGAHWLGWEISRFGRSAQGEQFLQGNWRSVTEVWQQGIPVWIDRQQLLGGSDLLHNPNGLAGCPIVGSFALVGQSISADVVAEMRQCCAALDWEGTVGITRLMTGVLCRYRGYSTTAARHGFSALWSILRPLYLGRSVCPPRIWI